MYVLQSRGKYDITDRTWLDITSSSDYDFILQLASAYSEKYTDNLYRVIEVFIYV